MIGIAVSIGTVTNQGIGVLKEVSSNIKISPECVAIVFIWFENL